MCARKVNFNSFEDDVGRCLKEATMGSADDIV